MQAEFNIRAGSVDNQAGGQYVAGARFVPHPMYNSAYIIKDYAVITTATPFTFNDFLQPIALVSPSLDRNKVFHLEGQSLEWLLQIERSTIVAGPGIRLYFHLFCRLL